MEELLKAIRHAVPCWEHVFMYGGCYGLYLIIKSVYPEAECWYDQIRGHVFTFINNKYWDIYGYNQKEDHWIRIEEEPNILNQALKWKCGLV